MHCSHAANRSGWLFIVVLIIFNSMLMTSGSRAQSVSKVAVASPATVSPAVLPTSCVAQLYQTPFYAFRDVTHCVQAWTEYNPSTCAPISIGNYKISAKPKRGVITYGTLTGHLGNGQCSTHTFTFKTAIYKWTDPGPIYDTDAFTLVWYTEDGRYDESFPMSDLLVPRIVGPKTAWWFNKQTPAGYPTTITLTANPPGYPSYTWSIAAGSSKVKLVPSTTDTVDVTSISGSTSLNDVSITVKVNGGTSNPYKLTVNQPKHLSLLSNVDQISPSYAYVSYVHYKILDQFGKILPSNVPLNEHWTSGIVADFKGMNWERGPNGGATLAPSDWNDVIEGERPGHVPTPQQPHGGNTKVYHWNGEWSIGSADPSGGKGVRVQTNTWQKYQDHARHTNVASPATDVGLPF